MLNILSVERGLVTTISEVSSSRPSLVRLGIAGDRWGSLGIAGEGRGWRG